MAETDTNTALEPVDLVSFIRLTPHGLPVEHWLAILGKRGFPVVHDDDPYFVQPCDKQSRKALRLSKIDPLKAALASIRPGGILGVPDFAHFGALELFFDVAERLAGKGCRIQCATTGLILDPAKGKDVAAGARMVTQARNRRKGRAMTEARIAAGIASGPKKALTGQRLAECQAMYVDLDNSIPVIAEKLAVSRSTVIRAMGVARSEAIAMHRRGEWPPAIKRRRSTIKAEG